ncbi:MAG: Biosynthetic arginine decarboxylase [Candidatus Thorarchaeota archaeon]|nr:MAG: Biosynthetic arginine decarboxylase [Candidatus Thorarchaeota archaeon]
MSTDQWTIERSKLVYGLDRNDLHFLDIDDEGNLLLRIGDHTISFKEITDLVREQNGSSTGYTSSFTLRMPQLITYQMMKLKASFARAMKEADYQGEFSAVYPVKVNQRYDCVMPVLASDSNYGLEAGTKAELFLIKSVTEKEKHRLIICNGAKDPEYLKSIQQCVEEGYNLTVSIESFHEAEMIVELLDPEKSAIVLRIKPYLMVRGHWSHSAGRDSKFGLSIHDLYDVIELLKEKGFTKSVTTILGHVGSQITAMDDFHKFAKFMVRVYHEVRKLGLTEVRTIDFGGGLPIDYTSSHPPDLMNQYADALVAGILDGIEEMGGEMKHPNILTESGRGITALGSAVVVKILEVRSVFPSPYQEISEKRDNERDECIANMRKATSVAELLELWSEFHALHGTSNGSMRDLFENELLIGDVRSELRRQLARIATPGIRPEKLVESIWHPDHLAIGNFSVFNAACDYVLVNQHFPIVPIQDLHVRPETTVRLVDITCDSDGELSQFHRKGAGEIWWSRDYRPLTMRTDDMGQGIPVGYLKNIQGSYFVIGLTGAYQDVIEADHNLLGDLPDVEIVVTEEGDWKITWTAGAQKMEDLLADAGYEGFDIDEDPYMAD